MNERADAAVAAKDAQSNWCDADGGGGGGRRFESRSEKVCGFAGAVVVAIGRQSRGCVL